MSNYQDLLTRPEWIKFKKSVLRAWGGGCMRCEAEDRPLHVHHKRYIKGLLPWEYEMQDLEVLCDVCHRKEHDPDLRSGASRPIKHIANVMVEMIEGMLKKLKGK